MSAGLKSKFVVLLLCTVAMAGCFEGEPTFQVRPLIDIPRFQMNFLQANSQYIVYETGTTGPLVYVHTLANNSTVTLSSKPWTVANPILTDYGVVTRQQDSQTGRASLAIWTAPWAEPRTLHEDGEANLTPLANSGPWLVFGIDRTENRGSMGIYNLETKAVQLEYPGGYILEGPTIKMAGESLFAIAKSGSGRYLLEFNLETQEDKLLFKIPDQYNDFLILEQTVIFQGTSFLRTDFAGKVLTNWTIPGESIGRMAIVEKRWIAFDGGVIGGPPELKILDLRTNTIYEMDKNSKYGDRTVAENRLLVSTETPTGKSVISEIDFSGLG